MDGRIVIGTELDTKGFDKQIAILERQLNDYISDLESMTQSDTFNEQSQEVLELQANIQKLTNRISALKKKQQELEKTDFSKIKSALTSVGNSTEKVIKKIGRWGLAIFGIRSAYMMVRNAMNVISQQDEQLAADIQYIKTALAYTLEPIVRGIVELVKNLLYYVGYIIKAWTGKDIFKNANKGLKSATANTKELNKELNKTVANFDELNTLQSTSKASGTGDGVVTPSFDLTSGDIKIPKWLEWIVNNKGTILKVLGALATTIFLVKSGLGGIKSLGIGIAVYGLLTTIEAIIDYIKDPSFDNFIKILEGIAITVGGIAIAFGLWPLAIGAAIALVVIEIVKNFDKIKDYFNRLVDWLDTNILGGLRDLFGPIGDIIYLPFKLAIDTIKTIFEGFYGGIKKIFEGIVQICKGDFVGGIKKVLSGLADILILPFKTAYNTVKTVFTTLINFVIDTVNALIDAINVLPGVNIKKISRIGEKKSSGFGGGGVGSRAKGGIFYPSKLPKLAVGGIINNPGPGVPYNGAYIGERGAEAVVPLTDSQQMELLGETIGRYITVNATIPVYAYNRKVDQQMRIIKAEDNFAYNR